MRVFVYTWKEKKKERNEKFEDGRNGKLQGNKLICNICCAFHFIVIMIMIIIIIAIIIIIIWTHFLYEML
jgi:hypothetical protein